METYQIDRKIIELLLAGVMPERNQDIHELWEKYDPKFIVHTNDKCGVLFQAKPKKLPDNSYQYQIEFSLLATDWVWLLGFAGWKTFQCYIPATFFSSLNAKIDLPEVSDHLQAEVESSLSELLYAIKSLKDQGFVSFEWPPSIPKPQATRPNGVENQATFDCLMFATAYIFLHEIQHVAFRRNGDAPKDARDEELACDKFAREFILNKIERYCENTQEDFNRVLSKRASGIALGAFILYLITPTSDRNGTDDYPPISQRLKLLIGNTEQLDPSDNFWLFTSALMTGLLRINNQNLKLQCDNGKELCNILIGKLSEIHER